MKPLILTLALLPAPLHAACYLDGMRKVCVPERGPETTAFGPRVTNASLARRVPAPTPNPVLAPGDTLPDNANMVIGTDYHGLPAAQDGWVYFRVGEDIYRADLSTRQVLQRITE